MADKKEQQRRGLASKDLNSPVDSGFASGSDHVSSLLSRLSSHNSSATPPKTELNVWTVAECDASIAEMRKDMATMDKDKLVEKYPTMKGESPGHNAE